MLQATNPIELRTLLSPESRPPYAAASGPSSSLSDAGYWHNQRRLCGSDRIRRQARDIETAVDTGLGRKRQRPPEIVTLQNCQRSRLLDSGTSLKCQKCHFKADCVPFSRK